jgi:hypothetical protein
MAYLTNRQAPNSGLANLLAMKGRMGDTELVHMSKPEIDMMERMGKMTSNPMTGLPEAFSLEDEITGLTSLMNMPSAKTAMTDLMEFGKEKLKTLNMKELQKEMPPMPPPPQQQQVPIQMPMPQPQQGRMASLRSGGLVSFGEDIKKAIRENDQDIEPFLSGIEELVKFRFGVDVSGGSQPTIGTTTPSTNIAEPQVVAGGTVDINKMKNDFGGVTTMPVKLPEKGQFDFSNYKRDKDAGILYPAMSAGRRPKDYFEGQVYDDRGDGMTDSINFKVEGDPVIKGARLSADEYVLPADLVAMLGNGSSDAGAEKLDKFTKEMRVKAFGTPKQQRKINATKELRDMA